MRVDQGMPEIIQMDGIGYEVATVKKEQMENGNVKCVLSLRDPRTKEYKQMAYTIKGVNV